MTVAVMFACVYLRAFSQSCERQAVCGVEWDLNCSAANGVGYSAGQGVGAGIVALLIAAEVRRRWLNAA